MSENPEITFHGGVGDVTGANFLIEFPGVKPVRVLVDCGLFQGGKMFEDRNWEPFPYEPSSIDYLLITHAHIDHTGRIPKLVKDGFKGVIYSTHPTKDLAEVMLIDSMGVLAKEARGAKIAQLYDEKNVHDSIALWRGVDYHQETKLGEDVRIRFLDAGHTLGSSVIEILWNGKRIVFTGDLGNSPAPLLSSAESVENADYLIIESVYGDRIHEHRAERQERLRTVIQETMHAKGVLMIPAFSLERTQEVLYEIERMMEEGAIPLVPVYVDSPLAIKVTAIYKKYDELFNKDVRHIISSGNDIFKFAQLHMTMTTEESKAIKDQLAPKIIIAGSGMSNGGRILHHEKAYLGDPKNTLLLVGYQAARTLGRILQEGSKNVKIMGDFVNVRARVITIHGYSGHMDRDGLLAYVAASTDSLKKVFVCMGEPRSSLFLVQRLRDYLGVSAVAPTPGETIELF